MQGQPQKHVKGMRHVSWQTSLVATQIWRGAPSQNGGKARSLFRADRLASSPRHKHNPRWL